jgi:hypothetical protein
MNSAPPSDSQNAKPRRQDFASDDDFGEAYARWMMRTTKPATPTPPVSSTPSPRPAAPALRAPLPERSSARSEIEKDTWNQHTKARFMRAKQAQQVQKKP